MLQHIEMRPLLHEQLRYIVTKTLGERPIIAPTDLFEQTMEAIPALRSCVLEILSLHFVARFLSAARRGHSHSARDGNSRHDGEK
jgi:hypothetical protein